MRDLPSDKPSCVSKDLPVLPGKSLDVSLGDPLVVGLKGSQTKPPFGGLSILRQIQLVHGIVAAAVLPPFFLGIRLFRT